MPKRLLRKFLLGVVGAVVIAVGITQFTTTKATTTFSYAVTELAGLGGNQAVPYDINNSGQIVGYSYPPNTGTGSVQMRAVLWNDGVLTDLGLGTSSLSRTYASAINEAGQVACNKDPGSHVSGKCPYLWDNGNVIYIGQCGGTSYVSGINNAGQVAGTEICGFPFIWQDGLTTTLSTFGSAGQSSQALGINDRGQVVGFAGTNTDNKSHAVLWQNGMIIDLGTLQGDTSSVASSINKAGNIVGSSYTSSGSPHAVLWKNRQITDLGLLDGNATTATGINNQGTVVGYSLATNNYGYKAPLHAFVWRKGIMRNLNSLLPANSGWELTTANAINERGQIVGTGRKDGKTKPFLLTPVLTTN